MTRLRRTLRPLAIWWLCCQVAMLTAVPMLFPTASAQETRACTCAHGEGAACPMHHEPAKPSRECLLRSIHDEDAAALGSLLGSIGAVPLTRIQIVDQPPSHVMSGGAFTAPHTRPQPPDPPPPRA
jgi:hypothetical protein